jgi:hypothetical protein
MGGRSKVDAFFKGIISRRRFTPAAHDGSNPESSNAPHQVTPLYSQISAASCRHDCAPAWLYRKGQTCDP